MALASERAVADDSRKQTVPARDPRNTTAVLVLVFLTLLAAWLRLSHLGTKSLWLDEGATVALARASWQHFAWVWWHGEANLQTVYFLLMRGWIHGGSERGVAAAAVGAVRNRVGPAAVRRGSQIGATWRGVGVGSAADFQPGPCVLLPRSSQLYVDNLPGAAVFVLFCARGGRGAAQRLGAVDGLQHTCVLQS